MQPSAPLGIIVKELKIKEGVFPNLDVSPDWELEQLLQSGEENGIGYQMCLYKRK